MGPRQIKAVTRMQQPLFPLMRGRLQAPRERPGPPEFRYRRGSASAFVERRSAATAGR